MRLSARILLPLTFLVLGVLPAHADETFSLKVGYLLLSPEGEFAVSDSGVGTRVDLEDDLPYDDSENLMAEAALQFGPFRLTGGYLPIEFSGEGVLKQDIEFNGETYDADTRAASDVKIDLYDVGLTFNLLNFDDTPVRLQLGPEVAVKVIDADLSFDGETQGVARSESLSETVPIPTLGLRGRVGLADWVALVGRAGYMEYKDNSFLDADAQVEFSPVPLTGIFAGYRYFDVQVDESDLLIDAQFSGPYVGAFLRF